MDCGLCLFIVEQLGRGLQSDAYLAVFMDRESHSSSCIPLALYVMQFLNAKSLITPCCPTALDATSPEMSAP